MISERKGGVGVGETTTTATTNKPTNQFLLLDRIQNKTKKNKKKNLEKRSAKPEKLRPISSWCYSGRSSRWSSGSPRPDSGSSACCPSTRFGARSSRSIPTTLRADERSATRCSRASAPPCSSRASASILLSGPSSSSQIGSPKRPPTIGGRPSEDSSPDPPARHPRDQIATETPIIAATIIAAVAATTRTTATTAAATPTWTEPIRVLLLSTKIAHQRQINSRPSS